MCLNWLEIDFLWHLAIRINVVKLLSKHLDDFQDVWKIIDFFLIYLIFLHVFESL